MKTLSLLFLTVNILLNIWHSESCVAGQADEGSGCQCDKGFGHAVANVIGIFSFDPVVLVCFECLPGSYKAEVGNDPCTQCPKHSTSNVDRTGFICNAGYSAKNNVCEECSKGSYKAENGNEACKKCSTFFTTEFKGSTDEKSCSIKIKGLIAGVAIAAIIAICIIVVVIVLIIKSQRNNSLGI